MSIWIFVAFVSFIALVLTIFLALCRMAKMPSEKEFREYENRMLRRHVEKMNK